LTDFEYVPFKKFIVHELNESENDRFFEDIIRMVLAQNSQVEPLVNWIDGIAFLIFPMLDTEEIVKEKLNGIVHFGSVNFTKLDYRQNYPLRIGNQDYRVVLRKAHNNPVFVDLVRWIKTNPSASHSAIKTTGIS